MVGKMYGIIANVGITIIVIYYTMNEYQEHINRKREREIMERIQVFMRDTHTHVHE